MTRYAIFTAPLTGRPDRHGYDVYDCATGATLATFDNYRDALAYRDNL